MVSAPSSMLCPNMDAAIGVAAKIPAASRPGDRPGPAAHHPVHGQHGDDALDHLRQGQRPGVEAEDARGQGLRQERPGQLVDGDRGLRVERAVEERLPAHRHALDRDRVERRQPGPGEVPRVQQRGYRRDAQQRRPGPRRLALRRPPELPAPRGPGPPPERRLRTAWGEARAAVTPRGQGTLGTSRAAVSGMTLTAGDEGRLRSSLGTSLSRARARQPASWPPATHPRRRVAAEVSHPRPRPNPSSEDTIRDTWRAGSGEIRASDDAPGARSDARDRGSDGRYPRVDWLGSRPDRTAPRHRPGQLGHARAGRGRARPPSDVGEPVGGADSISHGLPAVVRVAVARPLDPPPGGQPVPAAAQSGALLAAPGERLLGGDADGGERTGDSGLAWVGAVDVEVPAR